MIVDKSLSRGLADRALDMLGSIGLQYAKAVDNAPKILEGGRSGLKHQTEQFVEIGQRLHVTQMIGHHPKWRYAVLVGFFPNVVGDSSAGKHNRFLIYYASTQHMAVGRGFALPASYPALLLREHAVERLFQRLNSMDPILVEDEIHDALCMALPVGLAARAVGVKQIVLPTRSGAFRGSLVQHVKSLPGRNGEPASRERVDVLNANTWIPRGERESAYDKVGDAILSTYREMGGKEAVAASCAAIPFGSGLELLESDPGMEACLKRFPILMKEHVTGEDLEGQIWERARQQAGTSSDDGCSESNSASRA